MDDWQFGTLLWSMLVFFLWFTAIWMFVAVFADIIRRDMSGWAKVGWIALIVVLPFLGILIYIVTRPRVTEEEFSMMTAGSRPRQSPVEEIGRASELLDQGKISADEFERIKARALA